MGGFYFVVKNKSIWISWENQITFQLIYRVICRPLNIFVPTLSGKGFIFNRQPDEKIKIRKHAYTRSDYPQSPFW